MDSSDTSGGLFVNNPEGLTAQVGKYDRVTASEQAEMLDIAQATGGIARFNHNDVVGILRDDFNQSQNYYTISYSPSNTNWNGNYRSIDIALSRRDTTLCIAAATSRETNVPSPCRQSMSSPWQ